LESDTGTINSKKFLQKILADIGPFCNCKLIRKLRENYPKTARLTPKSLPRFCQEKEKRPVTAPLKDASTRLWRTDIRLGRNIYALLTNDVRRPTPQDPLIGVMETSEIAENVVDTHNNALIKFGRHYKRALEPDT
jgi:hypothetical protein